MKVKAPPSSRLSTFTMPSSASKTYHRDRTRAPSAGRRVELAPDRPLEVPCPIQQQHDVIADARVLFHARITKALLTEMRRCCPRP
ncbi:hypothetical protein NL676_025395 [Syzygium grande]|nr:hypothetical protein NL676_025395 [Syzygium grande]